MAIYDPVYHSSRTGDSDILFQYQDANNTDTEENYATVGFESWDEFTGIQYTHDNQNSPGAINLADNLAIRITTNTGRGGVMGHVNLSNGGHNQGVRVTASTGQFRITPESGNFWIENIPPDTISVNVNASGYYAQTLDNVIINPDLTIRGMIFDLVALPAPESLSASEGLTNRVQLNWHAVTAPHISGYNLYRAPFENGPFTLLNSAPVTGTTFADTSIPDSAVYYYYATAVYTDGSWTEESFESRKDTGRVGRLDGIAEETLPTSFFLAQNYPNPFNPTTSISFGLPKTAIVTLDIYNLLGQHVKTLLDGNLNAGYKTIIWDGKDEAGASVSSGLYFYKLDTGSFKESKKMTLLK
jgi:hypothetical protein